MQASQSSFLAALAFLAGCTGMIEPQVEGQRESTDLSSATRDAGRDASRDARNSSRDQDEPDDDEEPADDEEPSDDEAPADDEDANANDEPDASTGRCGRTDELPVAQGLTIRQLALYQTVKIPLFENGAWVRPLVAPVVRNKKTLVRAFVEPDATYEPHGVRATLTLTTNGVTKTLVDERALSAPSSDSVLNSTFTFQVDGAQIGADTQLSVALHETSCSATPGDGPGTRLPVDGSMQPLETTEINKLKVVVVPVRAAGRLPATGDADLETMRAALLAYYPVPDVEITVRAPLEWPTTIDAINSNSWSDLLNEVMRQRRNDRPASNVYYFGLVQPAATFRAYCLRGCVLGLAPQTSQVMPSAQVALGASFADAQTYETMVHELGHAHGRGHAPCAQAGEIDGVDPRYPEGRGATGSWGWDSRSNTLIPPTAKDIMGYCEPNWISPYNYNALAARSVDVNLQALRISSGIVWRSTLLYDDGRVRWGGDSALEDPNGEREPAEVLDANGAVIDHVEVVRLPLSHAGAQFLYMPQPGAHWSALKLADRTLALSDILPPL